MGDGNRLRFETTRTAFIAIDCTAKVCRCGSKSLRWREHEARFRCGRGHYARPLYTTRKAT
jgi:ribosomal protein S27AE